MQENSLDPRQFPMITNYCEDLTAKQYVTNPAIAREEEIKKTMLVLLTPDKSALLKLVLVKQLLLKESLIKFKETMFQMP